MNDKACSFNKLARFDPLLTRIDPALDIDVFNSFMRRLPAATQGTSANGELLIKQNPGDVKSGATCAQLF